MGSIIVPESGLRDVKLTAIPGVPPNLKNPPAGCRFAERCQYVLPDCRMMSIPLYDAALLCAALVLLVVILIFNLLSTLVLQRFLERRQA